MELQLQNQSPNEYSGLISFRIDGFHLLAVQGTLKSFLQLHSSKELIFQISRFFLVHPSHLYIHFRSVGSLRPPWTAARQASLSVNNSRSLLKLMFIESVMPSNHLILCLSLLLPPSFFLSIRVFSNESALSIRWPKYWSFSFSISPSNEYSGLISFMMDWLDLLAIQGTLKSLLHTTVQKHQFVNTQLSLEPNSHIDT